MFNKKTIRRMPPVTREIARQVNALELSITRIKRKLTDIQRLELESQALWAQIKPRNEVSPDDIAEEHDRQMLAKVAGDLF